METAVQIQGLCRGLNGKPLATGPPGDSLCSRTGMSGSLFGDRSSRASPVLVSLAAKRPVL